MKQECKALITEGVDRGLNSNVIIVDLDGTLSRSDTLSDLFALTLLHHPLSALKLLVVLVMGGRARFKHALANHVHLLDTAVLPYNGDVIEFVEQSLRKGKACHLVSASHQSTVDAVAEHLAIFEHCIGSCEGHNYKGIRKLERIRELEPGAFTYVGDSEADISIWRAALSVGIVGTGDQVKELTYRIGKSPDLVFEIETSPIRDWIKQLRVHQWSKNTLLFAPLIFAQQFSFSTIVLALLGFLAMNILASMTYIINDVSDLNSDRAHHTKRFRPIAAGRIGASPAMAIAFFGILVILVIAYIASPLFAIVLCGYTILTLFYTFFLKRLPLIDVLVIGILFTARIVAGGVLLDIELSNWLLAFSVCLFPSLALAKRQGELVRAKSSSSTNGIRGRGYEVEDAPLTLALGVSSMIAANLVLLLYVTSDVFVVDGLYKSPDLLWLMPAFLTIWAGRIWLLAHRGILEHDPVSFSIRDKFSILLGLTVASVLGLAAFWG